MDKNTTREYRQAFEVVPALVAMETPLECFMSRDLFNPTEAATRLANYWKNRRLLFADRWLMPMTQTGSGALSTEDIALLRCGYMTWVPGPPQHTIIVNFSKIPEGISDFESRHARLCMYIANTVCHDETSRNPGFLVAHYVSLEHAENMKFTGNLLNLIQSSFPIKVSRSIVAQLYDPTKSVHLLDFLRFRVSSISQLNLNISPAEYYSHSAADMIANLQQAGFTRNVIPVQVGGTMNVDTQMASWTRMRLSIEDLTSPGTTLPPSHVPHELAAFSSTAYATRRRSPQSDSNDRNEDSLTAEYHRARRALYSRRCYHRKKLNVTSLEDQIKIWTDLNEKARQETNRLQELLAQANSLLSSPLDNTGTLLGAAAAQAAVPPTAWDQQTPDSLDPNSFFDQDLC